MPKYENPSQTELDFTGSQQSVVEAKENNNESEHHARLENVLEVLLQKYENDNRAISYGFINEAIIDYDSKCGSKLFQSKTKGEQAEFCSKLYKIIIDILDKKGVKYDEKLVKKVDVKKSSSNNESVKEKPPITFFNESAERRLEELHEDNKKVKKLNSNNENQ